MISRRFYAVALVCGLGVFAFGPAAAAEPAETVTTETSDQPGCGPDGLTVDAIWTDADDGVELLEVFVDGPDGSRPFLSVTDTATGDLAYSGPAGYDVGDGADYLFTEGWEQTNDGGEWVRIGASDTHPGWVPLTGDGYTVRAVVGEALYCSATLTVP